MLTIVKKMDSRMNCLKRVSLPAPFVERIPISFMRLVDRAVVRLMKFTQAISRISRLIAENMITPVTENGDLLLPARPIGKISVQEVIAAVTGKILEVPETGPEDKEKILIRDLFKEADFRLEEILQKINLTYFSGNS